MATSGPLQSAIAHEIWERKYRLRSAEGVAVDAHPDATFRRVARAAAAAEKGKKARKAAEQEFHAAIADFGFIPAGRILAGAGSGRAVTLFNCFVMGRIEDDLGAIFDGVKEAALTMQQGGGIGHDFSTLRPKGARVASIGADASGPVSFMDVWDAMCRTIMSAGARRGAMMATLRCDHPDIEDFIDAKRDPQRLRNFNLSVLVTDAFMDAVARDAPWPLVFAGTVYRTVAARALWQRIMKATYDYAEPGVIFIDRVNAHNNLAYCETISATNPCGEQPLPPYGACLLGSLNLARLVERPFEDGAAIDLEKLARRTATAVRFLDDIIDVSGYPLPAQRQEAMAKRRIGIGVTGLADALILCGVRYGSDAAQKLAVRWLAAIERAAYVASARLASEKGSFPLFDRDAILASPNVTRLDRAVQKEIRRHGLRNGCLTSIAPTGTISLFAGNVSSGIEPVFDYAYRRRVLGSDGRTHEVHVEDFAYRLYRARFGPEAPLTSAFVRAAELSPAEHLTMQAAAQRHVDSAISKTVNCPADIAFADFEQIYREAYAQGLKGCTTYRPNAVTGAVLVAGGDTGTEAPGEAPDQAPEGAAPSAVAGATPRAAPRANVAAAAGRHDGVVYMTQPLARATALAGYTYKLKWPESEHALYVTINDIEVDAPGEGGLGKRRRPFEIFINTKNLEHYAWTVALTRMISAVFRRGGDVAFVAEELKAVFDPQGGRWIEGRYVPSLLAAIGDIIEAHMVRIGFLGAPADALSEPVSPPLALQASATGDAHALPQSGGGRAGPVHRPGARHCPRCSAESFVRQEGCWICESCGFSRCG